MNGRRYRVLHETTYSYGGEVVHSHQLLHLSPRDSDRQRCLARAIYLDPEASARSERLDSFGNLVTQLEYDRPYARLDVRAELEVEIEPREDAAGLPSEGWQGVRDRLRYSARPLTDQELDAGRYRMQSGYVHLKQVFDDYGADCFSSAAGALEGAVTLMHKIHREFRYLPGSTEISTSVGEVLESKRGVCQDFAHLMIACLRSRGLAARYVSGYVRTAPAQAAAAADASHAWVSVYCPPLGWVDLDPTNDTVVGTDHIMLAWGRDFGDVSPLRGVIVGGGRHDLSVRVSVRPI